MCGDQCAVIVHKKLALLPHMSKTFQLGFLFLILHSH